MFVCSSLTAYMFLRVCLFTQLKVARAILENPADTTMVHLIYANVTYEDILLKVTLSMNVQYDVIFIHYIYEHLLLNTVILSPKWDQIKICSLACQLTNDCIMRFVINGNLHICTCRKNWMIWPLNIRVVSKYTLS